MWPVTCDLSYALVMNMQKARKKSREHVAYGEEDPMEDDVFDEESLLNRR